MHYSLQKVNSKYPLIVIATDDISIKTLKILQEAGIQYKIVKHYDFTKEVGHYKCTINKFYAFELKEYDKVCFIDADSFVIQNIDFIFRQKHFSGCRYELEDNGLYKIFGALWLCLPKEHNFEDILKKYQDTKENDEAILDTLYQDEINKTENWMVDSDKFIKHVGGGFKFYEQIKLKTLKDFYLFINENFYLLYKDTDLKDFNIWGDANE